MNSHLGGYFHEKFNPKDTGQAFIPEPIPMPMPMPMLPDMAGIMDILERGLALERVSPLPPRVDTRLGLVRPERSLLPSLPRSLWSSCSTVPRGEVTVDGRT